MSWRHQGWLPLKQDPQELRAEATMIFYHLPSKDILLHFRNISLAIQVRLIQHRRETHNGLSLRRQALFGVMVEGNYHITMSRDAYLSLVVVKKIKTKIMRYHFQLLNRQKFQRLFQCWQGSGEVNTVGKTVNQDNLFEWQINSSYCGSQVHIQSRNFTSRGSSVCAGQGRYVREYSIVCDGKALETNSIIL